MPDLIDDLKDFKKELNVKLLAADNEDEKEIYRDVKNKLNDIILEHEEFTVPF